MELKLCLLVHYGIKYDCILEFWQMCSLHSFHCLLSSPYCSFPITQKGSYKHSSVVNFQLVSLSLKFRETIYVSICFISSAIAVVHSIRIRSGYSNIPSHIMAVHGPVAVSICFMFHSMLKQHCGFLYLHTHLLNGYISDNNNHHKSMPL